MLHDRTNGDDDGFWSSDASTGEIWGMEVVKPSCYFVRRGVCKKDADLAFDMLPMMINTRMSRSRVRTHLR